MENVSVASTEIRRKLPPSSRCSRRGNTRLFTAGTQDQKINPGRLTTRDIPRGAAQRRMVTGAARWKPACRSPWEGGTASRGRRLDWPSQMLSNRAAGTVPHAAKRTRVGDGACLELGTPSTPPHPRLSICPLRVHPAPHPRRLLKGRKKRG